MVNEVTFVGFRGGDRPSGSELNHTQSKISGDDTPTTPRMSLRSY